MTKACFLQKKSRRRRIVRDSSIWILRKDADKRQPRRSKRRVANQSRCARLQANRRREATFLKEEAQSPRCSGLARWASHCIPRVSGWMFAPEILLGGLASGLASTGAFEFARNMTKSE